MIRKTYKPPFQAAYSLMKLPVSVIGYTGTHRKPEAIQQGGALGFGDLSNWERMKRFYLQVINAGKKTVEYSFMLVESVCGKTSITSRARLGFLSDVNHRLTL